MFPEKPGNPTFRVRVGTTFHEVMDVAFNDAPIDFTGWSGEFTVWDKQGNLVWDFVDEGTDGMKVVLGSDGSIEIIIPASVTEAANPTCGKYRLTLTDTGGTDTDPAVHDWLAGPFILEGAGP